MCTINKESTKETSYKVKDLIAKKRDSKEEMTTEEINFWVKGVLAGARSTVNINHADSALPAVPVSDAQLGAWLMAVILNGLSPQETADLTKAMLNNGQIFDWPKEWKPTLVDKHSIGGVGDKVISKIWCS